MSTAVGMAGRLETAGANESESSTTGRTGERRRDLNLEGFSL